jgi:hypothetical protein
MFTLQRFIVVPVIHSLYGDVWVLYPPLEAP